MEQAPKTAEAAKPKSRTLLYAIIVIVLIVVGASVYILFQPKTTPPTGTPVSIWDTGPCTNATQCGFKDANGNINVTISVGTAITWTNNGANTHTTTSCDSSHASTSGCPGGSTSTEVWDSAVMSPGGTFTHTFNTKGTFAYYCTLHPWMHGEIIVQ